MPENKNGTSARVQLLSSSTLHPQLHAGHRQLGVILVG